MASGSTSTSSQTPLQQANQLARKDPKKAEQILKTLIEKESNDKDESALQEKEAALVRLGQLYRDQKNPKALADVVRQSRTLLTQSTAKAKTAKLVRTLIDLFTPISTPESSQIQIQVTKEVIDWANQEKRMFLKHSLEIRLVGVYLSLNLPLPSLHLTSSLLKALKPLDDKLLLTEVHLLASRTHHSLSNFPKAKSELTSARTNANAIYCPPGLQAGLDLMSGVMHSEDRDYKTAYSYFFEALEGLSSQEDPRAVSALKYMLLCKIMLNLPEDVVSISQSKLAQKWSQPPPPPATEEEADAQEAAKATAPVSGAREVEAMKAVAKAHEERNLAEFQVVLKKYRKELSDDPIIRNHLAALYDTLLEQNLTRIIEPYSRVEISYVAERVKQPIREVEQKLSQMILDRVFYGVIDQEAGCLLVYEEPEEDKTYDACLDTLKNISQVVESLHTKALQLR